MTKTFQHFPAISTQIIMQRYKGYWSRQESLAISFMKVLGFEKTLFLGQKYRQSLDIQIKKNDARVDHRRVDLM